MKRDLEQVLINVFGKPFEPSLTLGGACFQALNGVFDSDAKLNGDEKMKIYRVGKKVANGGVVDFSTEELAMIKERVGKMYGAMSVGAIFDTMDADYRTATAEICPYVEQQSLTHGSRR
jgi:hypothetical protein